MKTIESQPDRLVFKTGSWMGRVMGLMFFALGSYAMIFVPHPNILAWLLSLIGLGVAITGLVFLNMLGRTDTIALDRQAGALLHTSRMWPLGPSRVEYRVDLNHIQKARIEGNRDDEDTMMYSVVLDLADGTHHELTPWSNPKRSDFEGIDRQINAFLEEGRDRPKYMDY